MTSGEITSMVEPQVFTDTCFMFSRRLAYDEPVYRVQLPTEDTPGMVEYMGHPADKHRLSDYASEVRSIAVLARLGMDTTFERAGFRATYNDDEQFGSATFGMPDGLTAQFPPEAAANDLGLLTFRGVDKAQYSSVDQIAALGDAGAVLLSRDTIERRRLLCVSDFVESWTFLTHDLLVHAPAWLALPPTLIAQLRHAAQEKIVNYRLAEPETPEHAVALRQLEIMSCLLDDTVVSNFICYVAEARAKTPLNIGRRICKLLGEAESEATTWERLIYTHIVQQAETRTPLESRALGGMALSKS